ncbi:hypothetical protein llap_6418 [Limosa lapponica baueri]|uniref:Uncharacterized protein n=1 Tax=Limosa lapponica baueri TaxID=1758121 RepID=A0A2I0UBA6_LIMLA|nr:hypothetical protein llap_6418 [Limosa lapponica baueri]
MSKRYNTQLGELPVTGLDGPQMRLGQQVPPGWVKAYARVPSQERAVEVTAVPGSLQSGRNQIQPCDRLSDPVNGRNEEFTCLSCYLELFQELYGENASL